MMRATLTRLNGREGDTLVAHCPDLGVASCKKSPDRPLSMLKEAMDLDIENVRELGFLEDIR